MLIDDASTTSNLLQEGPPSSFKVEYLWKEGGDTFDRLAFFNTMARDMGVLTSYSWSLALNDLKFRSDFGIRISFVCDRFAPEIKAKYVVWTLQKVFDAVVENDRYATGTIMMYSDWGSFRIAVGSVMVPKLTSTLGNETDIVLPGMLIVISSPPSPLQMKEEKNPTSI